MKRDPSLNTHTAQTPPPPPPIARLPTTDHQPPGAYAPSAGLAHCTNCTVGRFLRDQASDASKHDEQADCRVCKAGFYAAAEGMTECDACSAGKYLEFDDRDEYDGFHDKEADCLMCDAGSYSFSNSSSCHDWYVW